MSMKPQPIPEIPLETVRVVRAAFPTDAESLVASQTAYRVDPVGLTAKDYRWQA